MEEALHLMNVDFLSKPVYPHPQKTYKYIRNNLVMENVSGS